MVPFQFCKMFHIHSTTVIISYSCSNVCIYIDTRSFSFYWRSTLLIALPWQVRYYMSIRVHQQIQTFRQSSVLEMIVPWRNWGTNTNPHPEKLSVPLQRLMFWFIILYLPLATLYCSSNRDASVWNTADARHRRHNGILNMILEQLVWRKSPTCCS